jgi:FkbM family methyltransferase
VVRIRKISGVLPDVRRDFIYDILPDLPLQLAVDVGAAAGAHTRRIRLAGGSDLKVVAFEPFPGNHAFFEQRVHDLDNVTLIRKAVSDRADSNLAFVVPSIVQGTEAGWQEYAGYSSVGFLASGVPVLKKWKWLTLSLLGRITGRSPARRSTVMHVDTTTLDAQFSGQTIDYLKVDVQGSEADVLRGAKGLLASGKIGVIYIEWPGGSSVPEILAAHGYEMFDSVYVAGLRNFHRSALESIGFTCVKEIHLSEGGGGMELVLRESGAEPAAAIQAARRAGVGWIQTDLVAVSPNMTGEFNAALQRYAKRIQPDETRGREPH